PQVNAIHLNEIEGKIEFENVDFKYFEDNEQYILENINFTVLPGQQLGIIGSTGSGKSTLVYLLARLIDPIKGMIKVDGVNIKEMDLDQLRSSIGFVLQKNVLFTGSVAHNLRWGDQSATQETLDWAAEISNIKEFIDGQEAGYDYEIQQGGSNLSGGQRQRMCLARALVIKPKILVLDDSTSALDSQTEKQINEAFKEKLQGTTIVNIAQKISSIAHCDQILVLDEGKLVGKGTHNQLLETCQVYQEIYASQLKKGGDFDVAQ
ncbi:MAG: ABC transporter ATP-binding protein, partial [Erysipelothrix sp.]|nr:ABC transporter ATP-binding protein [Erysipelothrix sp.]